MDPILAGIETEYGLLVEGRTAGDQVEDAMALVRSYPNERLSFCWDYSLESPRSDLRGFRLDRLAVDPADAEFDRGRSHGPSEDVRSDQALPNGARFYNDHGHPEYSTPECWGLTELALHDRAGEELVLLAARAYSAATGREAKIYKNNSDGHGASYGAHESYLAPRSLGFEKLFEAVTPMLVARTLLCGAGKVGSESGASCGFQLSQRADFFSEAANAETLYRRPVFNTRDEPHADPRDWIRLHVISGDANMNWRCTRRKAGLVKLALLLAQADAAPGLRLADPVTAFKDLSRSRGEARLELAGGSWTTARHILEAYLDAAEAEFDLEPELAELVKECRRLLQQLTSDTDAFAAEVDWASKLRLLEDYREAEGLAWSDPMMKALDLAYHHVDPHEGLYPALEAAGMVAPPPDRADLDARRLAACEPTRAFARGAAVARLGPHIKAISWGSITFLDGKEAHLPPDRMYGEAFQGVESVEEFLQLLESGS